MKVISNISPMFFFNGVEFQLSIKQLNASLIIKGHNLESQLKHSNKFNYIVQSNKIL